MKKKIESIIRELVREYNFERQQEAISHEEQDIQEERAHSRAAYALSIVLEKALRENNVKFTRTSDKIKIVSNRRFKFVEITFPTISIDLD